MSTLVCARWNPPVSSTLADLEGVWNDLFSARDFSVRLGAAFLVSPYDYTLLDALSTAALTRYARSFTTGVRERLKVHVEDALNVDEKEMHERFMAIRNKHVAHPVNLFETHAINVGFCEEDPPNARATVVSTGTRTSIGLTLGEAMAIKALCETWPAYVRVLMKKEEERLLTYAQQLTASELLALPRGPVEPQDDPEKRRVHQ